MSYWENHQKDIEQMREILDNVDILSIIKREEARTGTGKLELWDLMHVIDNMYTHPYKIKYGTDKSIFYDIDADEFQSYLKEKYNNKLHFRYVEHTYIEVE